MRFLIKIFSFLAFSILIHNACLSQSEYGNTSNNTIVVLNNINDSNKIHRDSLIPYAIVKGIITSGSPSKPLKAKISLIDKDQPDKIKCIYNSHQETGKYLMILAPGKEYDMIIEANGFKAHYINIYLPKQTYYYELYQEIHFTDVYYDSNQNKIGEEISVNNIFIDIFNSKYESNKDSVVDKDYSKLIEVIEKMIVESDSIALEKLELIATTDKVIDTSKNKNYSTLLELIRNAIESTDTTSLNILNNSTIFEDKTNHTYFFNQTSENNKLIMQVFGKDTIWTLPKLSTIKDQAHINNTTNKRNDILKQDMYFDIGSSNVSEKYFNELNDIANLLKFNKDLKIEINGYADNLGSKESNLVLSKNRANSVRDFLIDKKINNTRIIANGKGELIGESENDKCRKVEMILFE